MTSSVLSTLFKSKTGRTPLIKPTLTNLSNLALTVGVVIPVSLDICLKDFLPSFKSDFISAISLLYRCKGKIVYNIETLVNINKSYDDKVLFLSRSYYILIFKKILIDKFEMITSC